MAIRRMTPYIWVTWLAKLLVGDSSCEWAGWFKAQHEGNSWKKVPSDFDLEAWLRKHTKAVNAERSEWEQQGYIVSTEDQNSFALNGKSATLGGKPDLVATVGDEGVIIDIKTGKPHESHKIQVMLYMYALPKAHGVYRNCEFDGRIIYNDYEDVIIPSEAAAEESFQSDVFSLIKRLANADRAARKVPSTRECRFCDISSVDCPERMEGSEEKVLTTDF